MQIINFPPSCVGEADVHREVSSVQVQGALCNLQCVVRNVESKKCRVGVLQCLVCIMLFVVFSI